MVKSFSSADVSSHAQKKDLWFIYRDKVLNATKFLDDHPGGEEVLLDLAGEDITIAFEDVGHSPDAIQILETLVIGSLNQKAGKLQVKAEKKSSASDTTIEFEQLPLYICIHWSFDSVWSIQVSGKLDFLILVAGKFEQEAITARRCTRCG